MNITESNKLIAEFMGWNQQKHPEERWVGQWFDTNGVRKTNLLFDTSWDWLMQVVEKIESLQLGDITIPTIFNEDDPFLDASLVFEITHTNCKVHLQATMRCYDNLISVTDKATKLEAVYDAVIKTIQWHNKLTGIKG